MNRIEQDTLLFLKDNLFLNQRTVSQKTNYSLGKINQALHTLQEQDYLNEEMNVTAKARQLFEEHKPQNAIILAAGYGMRMIPINTETPKGLLQIDGEPLIERQIRQLQEVGVKDITVVVGFMKEYYEYLMDEYHVKLLVNMDYHQKNNLHSLNLAREKIGNTYIVPCDVWCGENPFNREELYSWYMVCDLVDDESGVRVNRKQELVKADNGGNQMIGISYVTGDASEKLRERIAEMDLDSRYDHCFWEEALFQQDKMITAARIVSSQMVFEINTYEQLRELDASSRNLQSKVMQVIAKVLQVNETAIEEVTLLKKGMTNRSFLFSCRGRRYIMRIPGEGTGNLINRQQEYEVYQAIKGLGISDDTLYMNPANGYKMTAYLENARNCNAKNTEDVRKCMRLLRGFHEKKLEVGHTFDIYGQIEFYESLWDGADSCYRDYKETKKKVYELKKYMEAQPKEWVLTHIDAVPDNFLFVSRDDSTDIERQRKEVASGHAGEKGVSPGQAEERMRDALGEEICLIDWEYAGMQDPHVDIAMFAIYAMYDREHVEQLIDAYFTEGCVLAVRRKIYCYIAACGLLWSNWCEYKRQLGVEFGEYSIRQYRYAKEYYNIFQEGQNENPG